MAESAEYGVDKNYYLKLRFVQVKYFSFFLLDLYTFSGVAEQSQ